MPVTQRRIVAGREVAWPVDLAAAGRAQVWAREAPARLAAECAEMAEHFPHWILTLATPALDSLASCPRCRELLVPWDGAWRCLACRSPASVKPGGLAWAGHLPVLWPAHPRLAALPAPPPGHALVRIGRGAAAQQYLLVPLTVTYTQHWPRNEPLVRYTPGLLPFLGLTPSGTIHVVEGQRLCLYAYGQWNGVSVRAVLQQRVANHLLSLVKVAMGRPAHEAFIGKVHDWEWGDRRPAFGAGGRAPEVGLYGRAYLAHCRGYVAGEARGARRCSMHLGDRAARVVRGGALEAGRGPAGCTGRGYGVSAAGRVGRSRTHAQHPRRTALLAA